MYINLGIIGNPLSHTFSPVIHSHLLNKAGLCGGYSCYEADLNELDELTSFFCKYRFKGVNVTVPYKRDIMPFCYKIDKDAEFIGAVNTLKFTEQGIEGYNTDIFGFSKMLELNGVDIHNKRVLLLGAGGAARSAFPLFNARKPDKLVIANRTYEKARELACLYEYDAEICSLEDLRGMEFDVAINSTSLGLKGAEFPDFAFKCSEAAIDMVYTPQITSFLCNFKSQDIKLINGFSMLIWQAAGSFKIWTDMDIRPDTEYLQKYMYG